MIYSGIANYQGIRIPSNTLLLFVLGIRELIRFLFQQNRGKTSPEEAKRVAIAALHRVQEKMSVKIIVPHPGYHTGVLTI